LLEDVWRAIETARATSIERAAVELEEGPDLLSPARLRHDA
jgi:hypothetical protein